MDLSTPVIDLSASSKKRGLADLSQDERLQRSRERNREHARRTRQRKKAQLQTLQSRVQELQDEGARLEAALQDCSTANILLGLSNPAIARPVAAAFARERVTNSDLAAAMNETEDEPSSPRSAFGERDDDEHTVRAVSRSTSAASDRFDNQDASSSDGADEPCVASAKGALGAKPTIHWKNGYTLDGDGRRRDLSPGELDQMRRERNRLHAKMTRDRKKVYIETLSRAVADLEDENRRVREALAHQLNATVVEPERYLGALGVDDDDGVALTSC
mmetsp:Transcript_36505/g.123589  ORF Transcript_36505/g.123589 Transcript_36505/m.123589 type:complete len:275 (+) Transcript_36505:283-1107(+)